MTSSPSPQVLIVGAGAVGAFFGAVLARQGAVVSVVARSDYESVRNGGFRIESPILGSTTFRPAATFRDAVDASPPDYLILSTKVLPQVDRAALIRPAVGPKTIIVLLQNGLDIEADVAKQFPHNELLSCIAFIAVARTGPGEIHHQSAGSLALGTYPSGISETARKLAALFDQGGVKCRLVEDVQTARWQKALWNASFNPLSILGTGLDTATLLGDPSGEQLVRDLMQEVLRIAASAGHSLPANLIDQLIGTTRAMPAYKTSMALDVESGRPTEIEAILGNVVRSARRLSVNVPKLEMLYTLARIVEHTRARDQS
ncbi:MAG TPA: 2-dehydropantoate 2-reductase [Steroidobacteraceae bacterium]|nr:2-dehydropantoate 2-reductase [Steroidobacteraceae bacterium]